MRSLVLIALGLAAGTLVCLPAMAATVNVVEGQVSLNQGQGYKQVVGSAVVSAGDRVMATPRSRGRIVYADGCTVDVFPGAVVTVPEKCYQPMRAGLEAPVTEAAPIPWVPLLGAAAVIGVGACAVSGCFEDNNNGRRPRPEPRSPDGDNNN